MPYINDERRDLLERRAIHPANAGELNFVLTTICAEYIAQRKLNYANVNEVVGAMECAKLELYRRVAAPYEDTKIAANGDVYPDEILT